MQGGHLARRPVAGAAAVARRRLARRPIAGAAAGGHLARHHERKLGRAPLCTEHAGLAARCSGRAPLCVQEGHRGRRAALAVRCSAHTKATVDASLAAGLVVVVAEDSAGHSRARRFFVATPISGCLAAAPGAGTHTRPQDCGAVRVCSVDQEWWGTWDYGSSRGERECRKKRMAYPHVGRDLVFFSSPPFLGWGRRRGVGCCCC